MKLLQQYQYLILAIPFQVKAMLKRNLQIQLKCFMKEQITSFVVGSVKLQFCSPSSYVGVNLNEKFETLVKMIAVLMIYYGVIDRDKS